jgi:signal transduction histidine kinase
MSRLEQNKMPFKVKECSIGDVIKAAAHDVSGSLEKKAVKIKIEGDLDELPAVLVDADRLKQVLDNLLDNAANFTKKGSIVIRPILVGKTVKVHVSDTGRGMPIEARKFLFHKFQQAGPSLLTRDTVRGTGLGLYISKLIMEGMGGKITLESSEPGKGSTFSFTVPAAPNVHKK